jgi:hypothetical protein
VRRRSAGARLLGIAGTFVALAAAPAAAQECAPWPGEPPRLSAHPGEDPLHARWRALRLEDLARRARSLEQVAPVEAHLLWRRSLCLDPWDEAARRGAQRTHPLRIHRPPIAEQAAPATPADAWQGLGAPLAAASATASEAPSAPADDPARARHLTLVGGLLAGAKSLLDSARYAEALETAGRARERLAALPAGDDLLAPRGRAEELCARAELALGRADAARAHLAAALALDPHFTPESDAPELLRLYGELRSSR